MKPLLAAVMPLLLLNSCVFESPFEAVAGIPTDPSLLGRWEEVRDKPEGMLIHQNGMSLPWS